MRRGRRAIRLRQRTRLEKNVLYENKLSFSTPLKSITVILLKTVVYCPLFICFIENEENEKAMPTDEQLKFTVENIQKEGRRVDIIITHEAPASIKRLIDRTASINDLNIFLDTVQHNTIYKKWFFGSLHVDRIVSEKLISVWQEVYKIDF